MPPPTLPTPPVTPHSPISPPPKKKMRVEQQQRQPFRIHVIDIKFIQDHIWLFGVNEDWTTNDGKNVPRSVSVKIPFSQHILYDGTLDDDVIMQWNGVDKIESGSFKNLCLYDGNKSRLLRKIYINNSSSKRHIMGKLEDNGGCVFNDGIDPVLQAKHVTGTKLHRITELRRYKRVNRSNQETVNDVEFLCHIDHVSGLEGNDSIPLSTLRVCDFDIETLNLDPDPSRTDETIPKDPESNQVITICLSMHTSNDVTQVNRIALILDPNGDEETRQQVVNYLDEQKAWGVGRGRVERYSTEEGLLGRAHAIIMTNDVISGWNSISFDLNYLYVRAQVLGATKLRRYSKFTKYVCKQQKTFNNNQFIDTPGLIQLDCQKACFIQTGGRLESYRLNEVGKYYLGKEKKDMPWDQIAPSYEEGPIGRARVADYCIRDVDLVTELCFKRDYFQSISALSTMCSLDFTTLLMRGQQVRVMQVLCEQVLTDKMVMNKEDLSIALKRYRPQKTVEVVDAKGQTTCSSYFGGDPDPTPRPRKKKEPSARDKKYDGGYVIQPKPGLRKNVTVIDYASLYPSIIIAHNLCFRSLLTNKRKAMELKESGRDVWMSKEEGAFCAFVRDEENTLLPRVLKRLLAERTRVKGLKKNAVRQNDMTFAKIYDSLQLAIKVVCNSIYGFVGADVEKGAKFPCLPIAVTVTSIGRSSIKTLQRHIPERYPHLEVVYGDTDSVFVGWPEDWAPEVIIEKSTDLASELTNMPMHRGFMELEHETLFINLLLLTKKCYAGGKYDGPGKKLTDYFKGISSIRRDSCTWARLVVNEFLRSIVIKPVTVEESIDRLGENLKTIHTVELIDLSITRRVNKEYANNNLIQCKVVDEIRTRKKSINAVLPGTRVRYIVRSGVRSNKFADWGLEYDRALEIKANPKMEWYIAQIKRPITDIVSALGPQYLRKFNKVYQQVESSIIRKRDGIRSIADFCV